MNNKYAEDLREIKAIMSRSSRFISLSGLSGVSTGIIALGGLYLAYQQIFSQRTLLTYRPQTLTVSDHFELLLIALGTLALAIISALFFTNRQIRSSGHQSLDLVSRRLLVHLAIPLIAGGILCLILLSKGLIGLLPALTLLFYGLALINGSKYTFSEIRSLGIIEVVIGLAAMQWIELSLIFWAIGFGIVQIAYGIIIQQKHNS